MHGAFCQIASDTLFTHSHRTAEDSTTHSSTGEVELMSKLLKCDSHQTITALPCFFVTAGGAILFLIYELLL